MKSIAFIDLEVQPNNGAIMDLGGINESGNFFHSKRVTDIVGFVKEAEFLCGHNIIKHDMKYLQPKLDHAGVRCEKVIDTLYWSALLFPKKPYHALLKDEKLQSEELNNPLSDAKKAKDLFEDEVIAFRKLEDGLRRIYYLLLHDQTEFASFFKYLDYEAEIEDPVQLIKSFFRSKICENVDMGRLVLHDPASLAYALAMIHVNDKFSITPPWILKTYPQMDHMMDLLRNRPCITGCDYCRQALDATKGLQWFFGFDAYRTFDGEPLQEKAVQAAIDQKSILAIFPTGGGKSITFQVPALMSGENVKGLTVIISPLQSLMKDQVDNLEKVGIMEAVTINGLLDPIERANAIERVTDGSASLLYISPELLRSRTIEKILLGRKIVRFVIDEAHCFSAWGQDFRVDYLYIGDFIKKIQETKNLTESIPVSCFTATAKQKVIEDIQQYFNDKLSLNLELFSSSTARKNLHFSVIEKTSPEEKYTTLRHLLEEKHCPTIVYVSRTHRAYKLAERLTQDGYAAKPYHGKMDKKVKSENQDAFIAGEVGIMVATSAFGMGVDKKDVGRVIHYEISDSLENYIQEAGRAGRDENITADCYILYSEQDLDNHFTLLNQTKINQKEIQQIWKAIKDITRFRKTVSQSALEIARKAGWDESVAEIETRVRTAVAALEESGYIRRGQNMPRVFADSIQCRNAQEAIEWIGSSSYFNEREEEDAVRIIKKLISSRSHSLDPDGEAESRVDYIADQLGMERDRVIRAVNLMREIGILADAKDLSAYMGKSDKIEKSRQAFQTCSSLERFLVEYLEDREYTVNLKELNEAAEKAGCEKVTLNTIRTIFNFWTIKKMLKYKNMSNSKNHVRLVLLEPRDIIRRRLERRHEVAGFIIENLYNLAVRVKDTTGREEVMVGFSQKELMKDYVDENRIGKLKDPCSDDLEESLLYLTKIEALKVEGGFLVIYNPMTIERLEEDNRRRYKAEDYSKLDQFYRSKVQQIHIVGEYARKMLGEYKEALQFVEDYFRLNYDSFLRKYFKAERGQEIGQNISPGKFRQLFGTLSPSQLKIIKDNENKYITVLAGPGSGKTRVLVHKLASLILMEDVKHEQLLMLTFSRAAATEFQKRLHELVGNTACFIEIKTFHAYCFDLLGKMGHAEKFNQVMKNTLESIERGEVEPSRITKTVLVIDEAQDMDQDVYALVKALIKHNEEMRVIAVGDDDQNIFEFRGSSSQYLKTLMVEHEGISYELLENYRSKRNLVNFSNQFVPLVQNRLKQHEIAAYQQDDGFIRLVRYRYGNLLAPFVEDLSAAELTGSTCVLTQTNDEALQVTGLLLQKGIPAKLIQTNEGFRLDELAELRCFRDTLSIDSATSLIDEEEWEMAKRTLAQKFDRSEVRGICRNLFRDFEALHPKRKYISDFEVFMKESRLEDFYSAPRETIFVSTIHKAKGKEFDNVFLLLENVGIETEEKKRQLYVAMTRAKTHLTIHTNRPFFNQIQVENMERLEDWHKHEPPEKMALQLSHRDVWLDFFSGRQEVIESLQSGDVLNYHKGEWVNEEGSAVFRLAKKCQEQLDKLQEKGYKPSHAKVNFIVYWQKEQENDEKVIQEIKIVLPELHFHRNAINLQVKEDIKGFATF
ncbi:MAG: RecQ family ATP-dependent DNA helicase [Bacillota bacterium]|nr:RecQ family ATP-dependent DNA helicase [Bacillota bacterium]